MKELPRDWDGLTPRSGVPYDLEETERVDPALQLKTVIRSRVRFDVTNYIKIDDPKLVALITKVDSQGPGASPQESEKSQTNEIVGNPGSWSIDSFMG